MTVSLKSLSTKLYLGIAAAALVAWAVGVPGRTVLSLAAVGFMIAMHSGGHGGHAQAGRQDRGAPADQHRGHTDPAQPSRSTAGPAQQTVDPAEHGSSGRGCH